MNRSAVSFAIASAMAIPTVANAVSYKLSGQVNRAIVYMDDGAQSDVRNVDSSTSGTRWRLVGSESLGGGMKVGFNYEMQTSSAPSSAARPDQNTDGDNGVTAGSNIRQANVWFSGNWGKLSMGQGDGAGKGTTEVDLSGTATVLYHGRTSHTGGIYWRTSAGGTIACGGTAVCTAGSTFREFDGFGRYDEVRYDSPALGPVVLSASVGNDSLWEAAARLSTSLAGGWLDAGLFYGSDSGEGNVDNRYGGSASYLFSQGTNITAVYAKNNPDNGADADVYMFKLGHKWGPHAIAIQYGQADDVAAMGFEDTGWGVGYNLKLKRANTDVYAGYLHQELDVPTGTPSVEDINVFILGARVSFN